MVYICMNCLSSDGLRQHSFKNTFTCNNCKEKSNVITVDDLVIVPIQVLNRLCYTTVASCEGHWYNILHIDYPYIAFKPNININDLPITKMGHIVKSAHVLSLIFDPSSDILINRRRFTNWTHKLWQQITDMLVEFWCERSLICQ